MTATIDRPAAAPTGRQSPVPPAARRNRVADYLWAAARLSLGWIFLWAFLDKMFGWGFATATESAWVNGGSPTEGFLTHGTSGPFAGFYQSFAGAAWADALFMVGLAAIGVALMLGVGMRIAAASGAVMMVLMWTAALPPANNPFMDDHLVYAIVLVGLAAVGAGNTLGLGKQWASTPLVQRLPWLK